MIGALALAAALAVGAPAPAQAQRPAPACLSLANSSNTQYHPIDDHTIVIESFGRYWKLITSPSSLMLWPDTFFINEIRGTSSLCSHLDFDLYVAERGAAGFREPLIAQQFVPLTAAEGKALLKTRRR